MSAGDWTSSGPDFSDEYRQQARQLARRFAIMEGVVGVALTGGLTFGEADRYSDVDLIVYLQEQSLRTWYYGEAPLPEGESRYHNLRLNMAYLDFRAEQQRDWSLTEVWNVSRAEFLYDPEGLLKELVESKVDAVMDRLEADALDRATSIRFMLDRVVAAWLYRGDAVAAHHVLNQAVDEFAGLLHVLNGRVVPDADWKVALLGELEWRPRKFDERFAAIMVARDLTTSEASRRRHTLYRLLQECWTRIAPDEPFEDRTDAVHLARMLRVMAENGVLELDEYRARFQPRLLIQSPAYDLLWIDRQETGTFIRFNYDRLRQLINHELGRFLDYQQRLLRELAANSGTEVDS